jgi:hypothetical protein
MQRSAAKSTLIAMVYHETHKLWARYLAIERKTSQPNYIEVMKMSQNMMMRSTSDEDEHDDCDSKKLLRKQMNKSTKNLLNLPNEIVDPWVDEEGEKMK